MDWPSEVVFRDARFKKIAVFDPDRQPIVGNENLLGPRADYQVFLREDDVGWLKLKRVNLDNESWIHGRMILERELDWLTMAFFSGDEVKELLTAIIVRLRECTEIDGCEFYIPGLEETLLVPSTTTHLL